VDVRATGLKIAFARCVVPAVVAAFAFADLTAQAVAEPDEANPAFALAQPVRFEVGAKGVLSVFISLPLC